MKIIITKTEGTETIEMVKNVLKGITKVDFDTTVSETMESLSKNDDLKSSGIFIYVDSDGNYIMDMDERLISTAFRVVNKHSATIGSIIRVAKSVYDMTINVMSQLFADVGNEMTNLFITLDKEWKEKNPTKTDDDSSPIEPDQNDKVE